MAPPRKSMMHAAVSGALHKNPQRYRDRIEPLVTEGLGDAPGWLKPAAVEVWKEIREQMPWLNRSHRGITELACILQARQAEGVLGVPGQTLLLRCLGSMGATPTSSRFAVTPEPKGGDPADEYF